METRSKLRFCVLAERLAVCRLPASSLIPEWALDGSFFCVARTADELSLVCRENQVHRDSSEIVVEGGWTALKLEGPFPFSMTGVLASFLQPLAEAKVPIFAISTFDTDYVLVKEQDVPRALGALREGGHEIVS